MNRRQLLKSLSVILGIALLAYTGVMIVRAWGQVDQLQFSNPAILWLNLPLLLINLLASGKLLDTLLRMQGIRLSLFETAGISVIARFGNYLSFGHVGFALRMFYLKRVRKVRLADSFSGLVLGNLLYYLLAVLVALSSVFWLDIASTVNQQIRAVAATLLLIIFLGLLMPLLLSNASALVQRFDVVAIYIRQVKTLLTNLSTFLWLLFWAALLLGSFTIMLAVEFNALGVSPGLVELLYMGSVSSLAGLIQLTPAGIGVQEGLLLLAGTSIDLTPEVLLGASLLRRIIVLLCLAVAAPVFSRRLFNTGLGKLNRQLQTQEDTAID